VLMVVEPRDIYAVGAMTAKAMPFKSCTFEVGSKHLLRESGYQEFPCVVPRWNVIPNTPYAVGAMFKALPEIAELNHLIGMESMAAELAIAPLFKATDDGVFNPRTFKIGRGGRRVIVVNDLENLQPINTGADFNVSFTKKEGLQAQIRKALMVELFQPLGSIDNRPSNMTLGEAHQRMALARQALGAAGGRVESEWLQPMIERCFGIAWRAGVLGEPPETLASRSFTIRYLSPLARAQKLEDVSGMDRYEADLAAKAQINPEILDNYLWDEASREKASLLGVPSKFIPDAKQIAETREKRAQAQEEQAQQAQAMEAQSAMIDVAGKRMVKAA
jgi:hypothetical protein